MATKSNGVASIFWQVPKMKNNVFVFVMPLSQNYHSSGHFWTSVLPFVYDHENCQTMFVSGCVSIDSRKFTAATTTVLLRCYL